ncbi:MAG: glycosyltransferase [Chloroflexi bacterium]|jgi:glycosyltransferase involved in cell wall biosynthesis|nr:glycosyltransferase [Chloroflexota bacterium]MBT3669522.1 glycosyltransferase [Chloroflexota bacterium]MBT4304459.1 glycosyltransferase [Chloroflexota bacterium]MBT4534200.1 glycosyltransferase [Chloroflexota bacterium]MBT4683419.1 glycosyltransferase [Chloroflexota bacterium]
MTLPKVSIPITSFNQEKYIKQAVLSAVMQDYDNLQVVACDDGSSDNSKNILLDLENKYPDRLEVHINEKTIGSGRNRNLSFSYSNGKYIAFLDGDDYFLPGKINKQVEFMESHPNCALSYHDIEVFYDATNQKIFNWKDRFGFGDGNIQKLIERGNYICALSTMFRKKFIPEGGFLETLAGGADWLFFINLINNGNGEFCYIDDVLAKYRRHSSNITLNWNVKLNSQFKGVELIKEVYPEYKKEADRRKSDLLVIQAIINFRDKKYIEMVSLLKESLILVFPKIWRVFRIPFRELMFLIRKRGTLDPLLESLFQSEK